MINEKISMKKDCGLKRASLELPYFQICTEEKIMIRGLKEISIQ